MKSRRMTTPRDQRAMRRRSKLQQQEQKGVSTKEKRSTKHKTKTNTGNGKNGNKKSQNIDQTEKSTRKISSEVTEVKLLSGNKLPFTPTQIQSRSINQHEATPDTNHRSAEDNKISDNSPSSTVEDTKSIKSTSDIVSEVTQSSNSSKTITKSNTTTVSKFSLQTKVYSTFTQSSINSNDQDKLPTEKDKTAEAEAEDLSIQKEVAALDDIAHGITKEIKDIVTHNSTNNIDAPSTVTPVKPIEVARQTFRNMFGEEYTMENEYSLLHPSGSVEPVNSATSINSTSSNMNGKDEQAQGNTTEHMTRISENEETGSSDSEETGSSESEESGYSTDDKIIRGYASSTQLEGEGDDLHDTDDEGRNQEGAENEFQETDDEDLDTEGQEDSEDATDQDKSCTSNGKTSVQSGNEEDSEQLQNTQEASSQQSEDNNSRNEEEGETQDSEEVSESESAKRERELADAIEQEIQERVDALQTETTENGDRNSESESTGEANSKVTATSRQQTLTNLGFGQGTNKKVTRKKTPTSRKNNNDQQQNSTAHGAPITYVDNNSEQDEINTIASDETTKVQTREEENQPVPPQFIRYRLGVQLDKMDIIALLNDETEETGEQELSPLQRYRLVLVQLTTFIKQHVDPNAKYVSWKNKAGFTTMDMVDATEFPKDTVKISKMFDGYKANLREANRTYFNFCLHTPGQFDQRVINKLTEWSKPQGFTIYKCTVQAESSRMIGWLCYSMGFTNADTIKKFLTAKSSHEWGLMMNVITSSDKELEWKKRLKALQVLVPAEKSESAREMISKLFSQKPTGDKYRSLKDSYMFVSSERRCQGERLASIYAAMIGRQKFRFIHTKIILVDVIVKSVDIPITTMNSEEVTLREMILDIPVRQTQFGPQKLFQSVDFTADAGNTWFKNTKGEDGVKGYYLSYIEWDEAEALHVKDGLGLYLGQKFGKTGIYDFLSEDHWNTISTWQYNKDEGKWETPEELAMAANVLNDPMAPIMQAYRDKQRETLPTEITIMAPATTTKDTGNKNGTKDGTKDVGVQQLVHKVQNTGPQISTTQIDAEDLVDDNAIFAACTINDMEVFKNDDDESQRSSLSQLAKKRAYKIYSAENVPDMDSLQGSQDPDKEVHKVVQNDDVSQASSITDITNNTYNCEYHNNTTVNDDEASNRSSLSINSLKESDLEEIITSDMSPEEIEQSVKTAMALQIKRQKEKALRFIDRAQEIRRKKCLLEEKPTASTNQTVDDSNDMVRGKQKDSKDSEMNKNNNVETSNSQSSNNCDVANKK